MRLVYVLLFVVAVGYLAGISLEYVVEGESSKVAGFSNFKLFSAETFSFIKSAELSSTLQGIIDHASIAVDVGPEQKDPDGIPDNGDEYFLNEVKECTFHSGESISGSFFYDDSVDDGICIVCKLKGDCVDVYANFVDLAHGSKLGAINSQLAADGIIVSGTNFGSGPDTVIVFDGDTPGDSDEVPTPDPDLRASGYCSDCAGQHMLIIPENGIDTGFDNLIDSPDDAAEGGIIKFQFNQPRKIVSFDFFDLDTGGPNDKARAYSDFACTQIIGDPNGVTIPATGDGGMVTVSDASWLQNDARCLEIEYHDSGSVSNLDLECVDSSGHSGTLAYAQKDLVHGYTASEQISIPFGDQNISLLDFEKVEINILSTILDFSELDHGDVLNTQFQSSYGVKISGCYNDNNNVCQNRDPIVFNTDVGSSSDPDLEVDIGNISIVQENTNGCGDGTCDNPDDNANGGEQKFQFNPARYINSLVFVDADRPNPSGTIFFYSDYDCNNLIDQGNDPNASPPTSNGGILIPFSGDGTTQVLVPANIEKVGCMRTVYEDSGGLSRINLGCPLPDDPYIATMDGDGGGQQYAEESIKYIDFENYYEHDKWNFDSSRSGSNVGGHSFGITSGDDFYAHSGSKMLAGSGDFDSEFVAYNRNSIDISNYHDVVLSVWYSYEDTESADDFYFYYKDGSDWIPIFEVPDPDITPVQSEWENAIVFIPDSINSLQLQFRWSTSSGSEHVMIDTLEVLGTHN